MKTISLAFRTVALAAAGILLSASTAPADEIKVLTSGAFTAAYLQVIPEFERDTHHTIVTAYGGSMGTAPDSIPSRLQRGEPVDVVIMASAALEDLITQGKVVAGSRVDLVRSSIGMAVRAGAPKPDISSVDALTRTLLRAKSIAYSSSASGVYLSTELFQRLGVADAIAGKSRKIESEPVGAVVARGDAEIGFQQISELMPVAGIDYVGPLPPGAQRITVFSAGVAASAKNPAAARALIAFLASPAAVPAIRKSGLEPLSDEDRIRGVFEIDMPRLYSGTDARPIAALWTDPATHGGMVEGRAPRRGHAEIEQLWSAGFAARPPNYSRTLSVSVSALQFLTPDLAAVDAALTYTGGTRPDGSINPESKELLFALTTRTQAGWKILASRVVPVPSSPR